MMIDYDKLKIAYELTEKTGRYYLIHTSKNYDNEVTLVDRSGHTTVGTFFTLDYLIKTLKNFLTHENKYKIGQTVYYADNEDQISCFKIYIFDKDLDGNYCYQSHEMYQDNIRCLESQLYASKNELINDRIAYWGGFRDVNGDESKECSEPIFRVLSTNRNGAIDEIIEKLKSLKD